MLELRHLTSCLNLFHLFLLIFEKWRVYAVLCPVKCQNLDDPKMQIAWLNSMVTFRVNFFFSSKLDESNLSIG